MIIDAFGYYDIVAYMDNILMTLGCGVMLTQAAAAGPANARLEQRAQSFTIVLQGSVADVTPLFGPVREAEWAPSWAPRFLHPANGGQRDGAVFVTASASGKERLWLLTAYDEKQGRVEYVFVTPGFTANEIKIQVVPDGEKQSKATITYRHSALAPEGNEEVEKLDAHWAEQQRVHWEMAINEALVRGGAHE
ncbi:MAG TPA: hypothetical protein VMO75_03485 [Chthoniobacterales bacterium]|nr:hypothetical protein [Chthoniobacterales bacterium]